MVRELSGVCMLCRRECHSMLCCRECQRVHVPAPLHFWSCERCAVGFLGLGLGLGHAQLWGFLRVTVLLDLPSVSCSLVLNSSRVPHAMLSTASLMCMRC
jgi:hypothetical protein